MVIPTLEGTIDRRLLVNYRVDPDYLQRLLPAPFRPKRIHGMGIAGICLIRLKELRPRALPAALGLTSENAAHRIAVEWEEQGEYREGVYIPRRDTSSRFTALIGGRLFPGVHHHARFQVREADEAFRVHMASDDGQTRVTVAAHLATTTARALDLCVSGRSIRVFRTRVAWVFGDQSGRKTRCARTPLPELDG